MARKGDGSEIRLSRLQSLEERQKAKNAPRHRARDRRPAGEARVTRTASTRPERNTRALSWGLLAVEVSSKAEVGRR